MADLSEMYMKLGDNLRNIDPFGAFLKGQIASQELKNQALTYQKAQEDYEAQKGLRALFAKNAQPSLSEIGALSPEFAQAYAKNQFAMNKDLLEMQKTKNEIQQGQQKISETDIESAAKASFPALEMYDRNIASGMPQDQALDIFHRMNGEAVSNAKQSGASWVQGSYDPNKVSPEAARALSARYGMFTTADKVRQAGYEAYSGAMGKAQAPSVHMTPEGYAVQVPGADLSVTPFNPNAGQQPLFRNTPTGTGLAGPNQGAGQSPSAPGEVSYGEVGPSAGMTQVPITPDDIDILRQQYQSMREGPEKQAVGKMLADAVKQTLPKRGSFVSPEELSQIRIEEEKQKTLEKGRAEKQLVQETRAETLGNLPDRAAIESLIDESIGSGVEQAVKGVAGPMVGVSSKALEATKQLEIISPQLKSLTKSLAGAGSISDAEQKMMADAAGAIADPKLPPEARKAAFKVFMDIMDKSSNKPASKPSGLQVGHEENGYIYKGGDPGKQSSWEKK